MATPSEFTDPDTPVSPPCAASSAAPGDGRADGNLPRPSTSLIGRAGAVAQVHALLGTARLVTLTGVAGSGKTRLAIGAAHAAQADCARYPDGVWFLDLTTVLDPKDISSLLATTLGIRESPRQAVGWSIVDALRTKRLLLVADACESVLSGCVDLLAGLLLRCPDVSILATSHARMDIAGEVDWPVAPLSPLASVDLFIDRARAVRPDCTLTSEDQQSVAALCQQLNGLPLAIELAAVRVNTISVAEIHEQIVERIRELEASDIAACSTQHALHAAIDWSIARLEPSEQRLFERLSVFRGGWTVDTAADVVSDASVSPAAVPEHLSRLVDAALIVADHAGDGPRYYMLETLRRRAAERLDARGETVEFRNRHAAAFLRLAEAIEPRLAGTAYSSWLLRLQAENSNLLVALGWVSDQPDRSLALRLVAALGQYWWLRAELTEGRGWIERSLARAGAVSRSQQQYPALQRARSTAQLHLGVIARRQGDNAIARVSLTNALAGFEAVGDDPGRATALLQLGVTANIVGDHAAAERYLTASLAAHRQTGDRYGITLALLQLALLAFWQGDDATAWKRAQENLAAYGDPTDRNRESTLWLAGVLALSHGDVARARAWLAESLALIVNAGDADILPFVLDGFAVLAAEQDQPERALGLAGAAQHIRDLSGAPLPLRWQQRTAPVWERARTALSSDAADNAWDSGTRLGRDEAIVLALEETAPLT